MTGVVDDLTQEIDPDEMYPCDEEAVFAQPIKGDSNAPAAAAKQAIPKAASIKFPPDGGFAGAFRETKQVRTPHVAIKTEKTAVVSQGSTHSDLSNGTPSATKIVNIVHVAKRSELAEGVTIKFPSEVLLDVFRVHGRSADNRDQRVGDASSTTVNSMQLHGGTNGGDLPVAVFLDGVQGKRYLLPTEDSSLRGQKALCVLRPGSLTLEKPKMLMNRVKQHLLGLARVIGSFDIRKLQDAISPIKNNPEACWLATNSSLAAFIKERAAAWDVPWASFETDKDGLNRLVPTRLINYMLQVLEEIHNAVTIEKVDLSHMSLRLQYLAQTGALTSAMTASSDEVLIELELAIEYTFLEPHRLFSAIVAK